MSTFDTYFTYIHDVLNEWWLLLYCSIATLLYYWCFPSLSLFVWLSKSHSDTFFLCYCVKMNPSTWHPVLCTHLPRCVKPQPATPTAQQTSALSVHLFSVTNPFCEHQATEKRLYKLSVWPHIGEETPPFFMKTCTLTQWPIRFGGDLDLISCIYSKRARPGDYSRTYSREIAT